MNRALRPLLATALAAAGALLPAAAARAGDAGLEALIECRADYETFMALAPVQADPLAAVARGWLPLPRTNPFMVEFRLPAPIEVFGRASDRIAFAGDGAVAILDLADPRPLARELDLETGLDTPSKVLFGREVRAVPAPPDEDGAAWIESAVVTVSNVDSHPGKTLAGCSYSRDRLEPEDAAEPPADLPAAAVPR